MRKTIAPWARRIAILALVIALCLSLSGCVNQYAEQVAEQMAQQEAEDAEPRATLGPMTAEMNTRQIFLPFEVPLSLMLIFDNIVVKVRLWASYHLKLL